MSEEKKKMSDEEALLRTMVADRDRRIALVKQKTMDLNEKQQRLLDELDAATEQSARQQITHQTEKTRMLHQQQASLEQLHQMEVDLQKQGSSLATYAKMVAVPSHHSIRGTDDVDEHHVMRMQAQLCKAMHSMGILDHQLELLQKLGKEALKAVREVLTRQREAKAQLELGLLNDLMAADSERRSKEASLKKELADLTRQIKHLKKQVGNDDEEEKHKGENSDDETERDADDHDEEMRKTKEDLQKLLEQRKQQVKELELQLDEQEAELNKLREKLGNDAVQAPEARPPPVEDETPEEDDEDEEEQEDAEEEQQNKARDEMAARLAQVMENAKLEDVEKEAPMSELDLLRMAQNRLSNSAPAEDEDEDEDSSDEDEDSDEEYYSEEDGEGDEIDDSEENGANNAVAENHRTATEEEEKKTADGDEEEENVTAIRSGNGDKVPDSDDESEGSEEGSTESDA